MCACLYIDCLRSNQDKPQIPNYIWEILIVLSLSPCSWSHLSIVHKLVHTRVKLKLTKHKFGHDHSHHKMLKQYPHSAWSPYCISALSAYFFSTPPISLLQCFTMSVQFPLISWSQKSKNSYFENVLKYVYFVVLLCLLSQNTG